MKPKFALFAAAALLTGSLLPEAYAGNQIFSDVPENHWAAVYVEQAHQAGWVNGVGGNQFAPAQTLSGAEFLTMVVRAFFPEALDTNPNLFTPSSAWYDPYWAAAETCGLTNETNLSDRGHLEQEIDRYCVAQVIANSAKAKGIEPESQTVSQQMADWFEIPPIYQNAVSVSYAAGILQGKDGNRFAGSDTMTRAEAAAVMCRMHEAFQNAETIPSSSPTPAVSQPDFLEEVVRLVNVERAKENLSPLGTYDSLTQAATIRASEIVDQFSHTRPDGTSCFTALEETGAKTGAYTCGENIAAGSSTPKATVEQWMNSPGHRANILNPDFTHIGVGYQKSDSGYQYYWVQMFVGRSDSPASAPSEEPFATPVPTAAPTPSATPSLSAQEKTEEIVRLVNIERAKENLSPLGTYDSLTQAAAIRAPEIVDQFSHTRPDGTSCFTALEETGANAGTYTGGENIAAGSSTPEATMEQWMNSPGHRANILNPDFTHIGVGYQESDTGYQYYWVQMFVGRPDASQ